MTLCGHSNHFIIHVQKYQKEKGKLSKIHRLVSLVVINFWYGRKLASHIYFSKLVKRLILPVKYFTWFSILPTSWNSFWFFFQLFTFLTFLSHHGKIPKYQDLGKKLKRQQPNVSALPHPSQEREVSVSVCAPAGCSNSKRGSFQKLCSAKPKTFLAKASSLFKVLSIAGFNFSHNVSSYISMVISYHHTYTHLSTIKINLVPIKGLSILLTPVKL